MSEVWKLVPGFEGLYEISSLGRVRSWSKYKRGELLVPRLDLRGYLYVDLCRDGQQRRRRIHRLVALAFIEAQPDGQQVRHLNGDKTDNRVGNLAYGTPRDNTLDSIRHGTHWPTRKTHCSRGHAFSGDNLVTRDNGRRTCRACQLERKRQRAGAAERPRTECRNGHPLDEANAYWARGIPRCRTCRDRRALELQQRASLVRFGADRVLASTGAGVAR